MFKSDKNAKDKVTFFEKFHEFYFSSCLKKGSFVYFCDRFPLLYFAMLCDPPRVIRF